MKFVIGAFIGLILGAFIGFVVEPWLAQIAFKVRPGLETLNFWQAMFSDHFGAWLFTFHRLTMSFLTTLLGALIGLVLGWYLNNSTI